VWPERRTVKRSGNRTTSAACGHHTREGIGLKHGEPEVAALTLGVARTANDPKKLLAAYDIYSLRIGALQRANERIDALIAIDFAKLLAPFLGWVMRVKKFQLAEKFQRQLMRLIADLEATESAVTKAEVKTSLNIAVSAITTIVAPEATWQSCCSPAAGWLLTL